MATSLDRSPTALVLSLTCEELDSVVVRTRRNVAESHGAGGIRGGDTCENR